MPDNVIPTKLHTRIVTPEGETYTESQVDSLTIPTAAGIITVYGGHEDLMSVIVPGELIVETAGNSLSLAVSSGVIEIKDGDKVSLLVETAERAEYLDLERAQEAHRAAEEFLARETEFNDIEFARIQAKLEKELARINIAVKYRNRV